jgi:hypothetical protein
VANPGWYVIVASILSLTVLGIRAWRRERGRRERLELREHLRRRGLRGGERDRY